MIMTNKDNTQTETDLANQPFNLGGAIRGLIATGNPSMQQRLEQQKADAQESKKLETAITHLKPDLGDMVKTMSLGQKKGLWEGIQQSIAIGEHAMKLKALQEQIEAQAKERRQRASASMPRSTMTSCPTRDSPRVMR